MPELPEVETIRRDLKARLTGKKILGLRLRTPELIRNASAEELRRTLSSKKIQEVGRRGKYLLFKVEGGAILAIHPGMTGRFHLLKPDLPPRHVHLSIELEGGGVLWYSDMRKFGKIYLLKGGEKGFPACIQSLGIEPLSRAFTPEVLGELLSVPRKLKILLLDQRRIAGIGNIYASEILREACLRPERRADTLSREELKHLHSAIRAILRKAVACGGSTLRDETYLRPDGRSGDYRRHHRVYDREGEPCLNCGTPIEKAILAERSTFFCPRCQK